MKKSKEQLEAEQIIATLLRNNNPDSIITKARKYADTYKYAIAQRVTLTICLCCIWDLFEKSDEKTIKDFFEYYQEYHQSFKRGNENIFKQMKAMDDMLGGELMSESLFDTIKEKANE